MKCPICEGKGGWYENYLPEEGIVDWQNCTDKCNKGQISFWKWISYQFWMNAPVEFVEWWSLTFYGPHPK